MIPTFRAGPEEHTRCIRAGLPYSFARYGEGEWRVIVPDIYVKQQRIYSEWHSDYAQDALRDTLLKCYPDWNYCPAIWHQRAYAKDGRDRKIAKWLSDNSLDWINWYDGRVWRRAIESDRFHIVVDAVRACPLPLIFVGPEAIYKAVKGKFNVAKFVQIHPYHAFYDRAKIASKILSFGEPAMISFSAGGTANILIHTLFPLIGHHSIMVDFGASWEVLSGKRTRPYTKTLTPGRIRKNWEGR